MYDRDMPIIRDHGLSSPEGLQDVLTFVLLTIRQPFPQIKSQMADVRKRGAKSKFLFGSKRDGFKYIRRERDWLLSRLLKCQAAGDTVEAIMTLTLVPGLGIIKAGFAAQCLGFESACLDMHNLARLGLPQNSFHVSKSVKPETLQGHIRKYLAIAFEEGDARYWWNSWCDYVAGLYDTLGGTGDHVSAYHCKAVGAFQS